MGEGKRLQSPLETAEAIAVHIRLSRDAAQLLRPELTPQAFFEMLVEREKDTDALRFLAHCLPKRRAVWWGCLCLWRTHGPEPAVKSSPIAGPEAVALAAAARWVKQPWEENRLRAETPGREAGLKTAAGCLAMASFWSGGSMT